MKHPGSGRDSSSPYCSANAFHNIEWSNRLLAGPLTIPLAGNTLQGCGKVLQKAVHALNQCPTHGAVSPTARIYRPRSRG